MVELGKHARLSTPAQHPQVTQGVSSNLLRSSSCSMPGCPTITNPAHPEDGSRDSGPFGLRTHKISRSPSWPTRYHQWHSTALVIASQVMPPSQWQTGSSPPKHGFPHLSPNWPNISKQSAKTSHIQDGSKWSKMFQQIQRAWWDFSWSCKVSGSLFHSTVAVSSAFLIPGPAKIVSWNHWLRAPSRRF